MRSLKPLFGAIIVVFASMIGSKGFYIPTLVPVRDKELERSSDADEKRKPRKKPRFKEIIQKGKKHGN